MAQRVQVKLIDDLNGEEAQETVRFALDGITYEIDLTTSNAAQLRSTLSGYVGNARKASTSRRSQNGQVSLSAACKRDELQQIRAWAQENGYNPSVRGRIPHSILDAYREAHQ